MTIIGITDVHGKTTKLRSMAPLLSTADLVVLSGDVTHFGGRKHAEAVLDEVRAYNRNILAVPGNCDQFDVGDFFTEQGINLDGTWQSRDGYVFIGLGGSLPNPGLNTPNERSDEVLASILRNAVEEVEENASLILVSHQPPVDASCDITGGMHVGSRAVRDFIETYEPLVCLTGHIHESSCIDSIGNTKIVNPGPLHEGRCSRIELTENGVDVSILHADGGTYKA